MSKKKKILFVITSLHGGGAERALADLLHVVDRKQYDIDLLLCFSDDALPVDADVNVFSLYKNKKSLRYRLSKKIYLFLGWRLFLRKNIQRSISANYDVIISFLEGDSLLYHSMIFLQGKKNVSWVHTDFSTNHWSKRHFYGNEENLAYQRLDEIVFVSNPIKDTFLNGRKLPSSQKHHVLYNIIDVNRIHTLANKEKILKKNISICSVGRLEHVKGYDLLIGAAAILAKKNLPIEFWIIGIGSMEHSLRNLLEECGISDIFKFVGYKANPYPYINSADIFVSSSRAEGLPLVICEAQCLGKPIIATRNLGSEELLKDGEFGILVEQTPQAIAEGIEKLVSSSSLQEYYARQSLLVAHNFSKDLICEKFSNII